MRIGLQAFQPEFISGTAVPIGGVQRPGCGLNWRAASPFWDRCPRADPLAHHRLLSAPPLQQRFDTPADTIGETDNLIVFRRRQRVKLGLAAGDGGIDPIYRSAVEMNIGIQRVAEALHECDSAALGRGQAQQLTGTAAQIAEQARIKTFKMSVV